LIAILSVLLATPACAGGTVAGDVKPSLSTSETMTTTARVEAIDHETRVVTLLLEDGERFTTEAGDEVRNFGQVDVGDMVYVHYTESMSIQVVADDGVEPEAYVSQDVARAGEGRMPGFAATESAVETAIVEAINLEDGTFKLREADGETRQYTARNPDNLRLADVGDKVVATVTTSVVITVDRTSSE
jgi:hypothetical protein